MRKITTLWLMLVMSLAFPGCSDNDEPNNIDLQSLYGTWYMTNIRGWENDEDAKDGKSEFNETFNYNGQGLPVGDNKEDAEKIVIAEAGSPYLDVTPHYWGFNEYSRDWEWMPDETGSVKLQGNKLIDGTLEVTITKLTGTTLTTYQKDEDGETYITYVRL